MSESKTFTLHMESRDYECDLQGIINNSVYLNYFEHTRHCFLRHIGLDFKLLHSEGIDAVARRIEIDYLRSLTGMDEFTSKLQVSRKGRLQYVFDQSIRRNGEEAVRARTYVAFVKNRKPVPPPVEVESAVNAWLAGGPGAT